MFPFFRRKDSDYPLNLNAGLNYTRYPTGYSLRPYPPMCGAISGVMPMVDTRPMSVGNTPFGVFPQQSAAMMTETVYPGLTKLKG